MPTKFLIINPFIIFLYIISFKILKKKILYILIILNLFQWIINYEIIEIKHKYNDICKPVVALDAKIKFSIQQGKAIDYIFNKKNYKDCYSKSLGKYSQNFKDGSPLKKKIKTNFNLHNFLNYLNQTHKYVHQFWFYF